MAYINPDEDAGFGAGTSSSSATTTNTTTTTTTTSSHQAMMPTTDASTKDEQIRGMSSNDQTRISTRTNKTKNNDFTGGGAGTLGDIMSNNDNNGDDDPRQNDDTSFGLVTLDGGTLAARFGIVSPLDRMALTANGNLQRLFSSYYDAPIHVVVVKQEESNESTNAGSSNVVWDRMVHLTVFDEVFCSAHSTVTIHDSQCQYLVESGQVGLGQLFRYLDRLPTFELMDAGYNDNDSDSGGLWRLYELRCKEVSCRIREDFHPQAWEMVPPSSSTTTIVTKEPSQEEEDGQS